MLFVIIVMDMLGFGGGFFLCSVGEVIWGGCFVFGGRFGVVGCGDFNVFCVKLGCVMEGWVVVICFGGFVICW